MSLASTTIIYGFNKKMTFQSLYFAWLQAFAGISLASPPRSLFNMTESRNTFHAVIFMDWFAFFVFADPGITAIMQVVRILEPCENCARQTSEIVAEGVADIINVQCCWQWQSKMLSYQTLWTQSSIWIIAFVWFFWNFWGRLPGLKHRNLKREFAFFLTKRHFGTGLHGMY